MAAASDRQGSGGRWPDFLVVGAAKAGTTAFFEALGRHPKVHLPPVKEPRYFLASDPKCPVFTGPGDAQLSALFVRRESDYRALFGGAGAGQVTGEASVAYLWAPWVPGRLVREVGAAKLMVLLRDPADRAYSSWLHQRREGNEPLARFADALDAERERVTAGWSFLFHYADRSRYATQLSRYLAVWPTERLKIWLYEDWVSRPAEVLAEAWAYLGIDPAEGVPSSRAANVSSRQPRSRSLFTHTQTESGVRKVLRSVLPLGARSWLRRLLVRMNEVPAPRMRVEDRARLIAELGGEIDVLEAMIGRDLAAWRRVERRGGELRGGAA